MGGGRGREYLLGKQEDFSLNPQGPCESQVGLWGAITPMLGEEEGDGRPRKMAGETVSL